MFSLPNMFGGATHHRFQQHGAAVIPYDRKGIAGSGRDLSPYRQIGKY
ncbi:MAG: hypothetical protein ABIZ81_02775 [Opitutaceae bacterium]